MHPPLTSCRAFKSSQTRLLQMAAAHLGVANSPEAADAPPFALIQGPPGMRCTCDAGVMLVCSGLMGLCPYPLCHAFSTSRGSIPAWTRWSPRCCCGTGTCAPHMLTGMR